MLYEITGIKEQNEESINIHLLFDYESPKKLRDWLQKHQIIILWIKEFFGTKEKFANIYAIIQEKDKQYKVFLNEEELFDAAEFLAELGFDIVNIGFLDHEEDPQKVAKILSDAKYQIANDITKKKLEITEQKEETRQIYKDKQLKRLQAILDDLFDYLEKLYPKIEWIVIEERITRLHVLEESLRKLRMGRNPVKIKEVLIVVFNLLDKIQETYFQKIKEEWTHNEKLFKETQVDIRDLLREYHMLKRAETVKELGIKPSKDDKYYIFAQKIWMYRRFLKKDFKKKLANKNRFGNKFFLYAQFVLIVIIVELTITLWTKKIIFFQEFNQTSLIILLHLGILAGLLLIFSYFKKQNLLRLFLLIALWILSYFIVKALIVNNFGL